MMEAPTAVLREEHREIRKLLLELALALEPLRQEVVRFDLLSLTTLLERHRRKEEEEFFPSLSPALAASVEVLKRDHDVENVYLEEAWAFFAAYESDPQFLGSLVDSVRRLIAWFRDHLWKEEHFIFDVVERKGSAEGSGPFGEASHRVQGRGNQPQSG